MTLDQTIIHFNREFLQALPGWNWLHAVLIFGLAFAVAYLLSHLMSKFLPLIAARFTSPDKAITSSEKFVQMKRIETFLSLGLNVGRVAIFTVILALAWRLTNPTTAPIAFVGASTLFAVLAGATLVPLLRDITSGSIMLAERWFNVGDHIVIEPFSNTGGVVEQITLRSTKLRTLTGEVVWLHNQHIQGVRVTTDATHTLAIETFVSDPEKGQRIINDAFKVIPTGPTTIPQRPGITDVTKISDNLWRITALGTVTPYREWIIDQFAVEAIKQRNELYPEDKAIIHGPIVYYASRSAEKRYRKAIRTRNLQPKTDQ